MNRLFELLAIRGRKGGGGSGGGSGGTGVAEKEVNFYDYDGTCLHAYTVEEAQTLSELPAGPEHAGLVFQKWNWSLENVKALTRPMNIGALYTTDDGTTRIYIHLEEGCTSPMLGVGVSGTVTVDWGDGTEPDMLTGNRIGSIKYTPNHVYAAPGDYVVRITTEGTMKFSGSTSSDTYSCILRHSSGSDPKNNVYQNAVKRIEIGKGVTEIGGYAFANCCSLESIVIPEGVTTLNNVMFRNCHLLNSITFPTSIAAISEYALSESSVYKSVSIPENVTTIEGNAFAGCVRLRSITMPEGITTIGRYAFSHCYLLKTIVIPGAMTSIDAYAFGDCAGVLCYDFSRCTTVPALADVTAFNGIDADCEIRVPADLYDEWIAATNWATYASQIVAV